VNIQKLISSVRQAKKLRQLNDFHRVPRSGVDVIDKEFNDALSLLKDILKKFEDLNYRIEISFYGEILITLNESGHRFELSMINRPNIKTTETILQKLEEVQFIKLNSFDLNNSLTISIKTMRSRSEWKHYLATEYKNDGSLLAEIIIKEIQQKVRYYNNYDQVDWAVNYSSTEDKLAAIHLGGALLGSSSMLFYLSKSLQKMIYVKDLSIAGNQIDVNKSYFNEATSHYFGKKEKAFFEKYLFGYAAM
jgi:hypothetical protein